MTKLVEAGITPVIVADDDRDHQGSVWSSTSINVKIYPKSPPAAQHRDARDLTIEEFFAAIGADIREGIDRAGYIVNDDLIEMPPFATFRSATSYYVTLSMKLHIGRWHKSRLNRDFGERFNTPRQCYAAEELVAELATAFLCAEFSLDGSFNSAGYIASFIQLLKEDQKAIFTCASKAQAAIDFLRDLVLREPAQAAE